MNKRSLVELTKYSHVDAQLDLLNGLNQGKDVIGQSDLKPDSSQTNEREFSGSLKIPEMLLILDTETTGLDSDKDQCLEVGGVLFNVPNRSILAQQSFLMPVESNEAEFINHIPAHVSRIKQPFREALVYLESLIDISDVLVAHNAEFDRKWFGKNYLPSVQKPWLCSMEDISWPSERNLRFRPSVRDLALAYEIPVWSAHRALTDCIYLAEVFRRCSDLEDLLLKGLEPRKLMRAKVSFEQRHLAKEAGFRWNDLIPGAWSRRLSAREASNLKFPVIVESSP